MVEMFEAGMEFAAGTGSGPRVFCHFYQAAVGVVGVAPLALGSPTGLPARDGCGR